MKHLLLVLLFAPTIAKAACNDLLAELSPQIDSIVTLVAHQNALREQGDMTLMVDSVGKDIDEKKQAIVDQGIALEALNEAIGSRLGALPPRASKPVPQPNAIEHFLDQNYQAFMKSAKWGKSINVQNEWARGHVGYAPPWFALYYAARMGNVEAVEGFVGLPLKQQPFEYALTERDVYEALWAAMNAGHLETALAIVKAGYKRGVLNKDLPPGMELVEVECVRRGAVYLFDEKQKQKLFSSPTPQSHLILRAILEKGLKINPSDLGQLATHELGLESLKEIHRNLAALDSVVPPFSILTAAAKAGRLENVKFLESVGHKIDHTAITGALQGQHHDVAKYVIEKASLDDRNTAMSLLTGAHDARSIERLLQSRMFSAEQIALRLPVVKKELPFVRPADKPGAEAVIAAFEKFIEEQGGTP